MAKLTGHETEFSGSYGSAAAWPVPDHPSAAETVCSWILTHPQGHPLWTQYLLCVVRLRDDTPGFPPPHRQFQGSTHELLVVALNPDKGPPFLTPVNIVHQIEGSDDEARLLAAYAAWGVTVGALWPETADAPDRVRADWKSSLVKTLAHIRGEEHAP
jgi:hypothetical protein